MSSAMRLLEVWSRYELARRSASPRPGRSASIAPGTPGEPADSGTMMCGADVFNAMLTALTALPELRRRIQAGQHADDWRTWTDRAIELAENAESIAAGLPRSDGFRGMLKAAACQVRSLAAMDAAMDAAAAAVAVVPPNPPLKARGGYFR